MAFSASNIPFKKTNSFSKLVNDYLEGDESLAPFYQFKADNEGISKAIEARKEFPIDRNVLYKSVFKNYEGYPLSDKLKANIDALQNENCFTICAAHQPNIFTGHLYFVYKILHAVKLANTLSEKYANYTFVPIYYMGSEDADLQELGELDIAGKHYQWETKQTGAVGRMLVDANLIHIIDEVAKQIEVLDFGKEIIEQLKASYTLGLTIEKATFHFVHHLLESYGVVIILPDDDDLKAIFLPIVEKELETQFSNKSVLATIEKLPTDYKIQTEGRAINLFYLENDKRERVDAVEDKFIIGTEGLPISKRELLGMFEEKPSRISPNVILRPVFQEMILPNIVFVGGGGELAYWLELKDVFEAANVFFPVLMLRNSFSIINQRESKLQEKLELTDEDLFLPEHIIFSNWVKKKSKETLSLELEKAQISMQFEAIQKITVTQDASLSKHVAALQSKAINSIAALEKKILRAAKHKEEATGRQINKLKSSFFPNGNLQERVDNIVYWYAMYGDIIIKEIYENSTSTSSSFTIIKEK